MHVPDRAIPQHQTELVYFSEHGALSSAAPTVQAGFMMLQSVIAQLPRFLHPSLQLLETV